MTNLFFIQQRISVNQALKRIMYVRVSIFLILTFSCSFSFAQVSNNFIDYTNGIHGSICATPVENANATFTAPSGTVFTSVYFASYGTPTGSCNSFATSSCNASTSQSVVEGYLLGKSGTINIPATNAIFGDPCSGTVKKLYAQAFYTQPICAGTSPGNISGTVPSVSWLMWSYQWEKSTTSATAGFSTISGANSANYTPGSLTQTTWFRRAIVRSVFGTTIYSPVLQISVIPPFTVSGTSSPSCVGGSTGSITANVSGGSGTFTYSLNSGDFQSGTTFSLLGAGSYNLVAQSNNGCSATATVNVSDYSTSTGNQNLTGTNTWIGHAYDGNNFSRYIGYFSEPETFNESFGGPTNCFPVTSSSGASSIFTESFSVAFKMNSTKKGLYVVDLGSDDGSRLTVDGTLVYNNWVPQGFSTKSKVLINLTGNSFLNYEFFEDGGGNQVAFQNLSLVLANTLSTNTSQNICNGNSGSAIGGDDYGTLPSGISKSETGYQWSYSTTPGGARSNISGATSASFTPNTSSSPFNVAGTYYVYRNAILNSNNNTGFGTYTATNESNAAIIIINPAPPAPTVTTPVNYCQGATAAPLSATGINLFWGSNSGTAGGTSNLPTVTYVDNSYSNQKTNFTTTVPNVKITSVNYVIPAWQSVSGVRLALYDNGGNKIATSVTTTTQSAGASAVQVVNIFNFTLLTAGNYSIGLDAGLGNVGGDQPSFPITEPTGIINITGKSGTFRCFNSMEFTTGNDGSAPTPSTAIPGTTNFTVTQTVNGCKSNPATILVIVNLGPSASISYSGSPFCFGSGTATVSLSGTSEGTFSSDAGLKINASIGSVDLSTSSTGSHIVTYSISAANGCTAFSTTTNITITPKVSSLIFAAGSSSTRCQGAGIVTYSASANNTTGITYSLDATSLAAGNSINSSNGAVTFVAGWSGTSSITALAAGCSPQNTVHTVTTSANPSADIITSYTCVDGSSGSITVTGNTEVSPFTYSLNGGIFKSPGLFTGLSANTYSIQVKSKDGCISTTSATVSPYPNSTDDESVAGADAWIGHMYNGNSFQDYKGYFNESETFDESFGGNATCFPIISNLGSSSIYTEQFSVRFKMNSSKKGLYVVDLGSDDGSRLTIDGGLVYNEWTNHSFVDRQNVLINLTGQSSLIYEFYENSGANRVHFQNLALVLANTLSINTIQNICIGNSGASISGDNFGTLPSGISKSGSGFQWTYSTTPGGARINLSGATGDSFIPNTFSAPFNIPGTYYVFRNAIVSSNNNTGITNYLATDESNAATIIINPAPNASISYANEPFCNTSSLSEKVTLTGTSGGVFSAVGLSINSVNGEITPNANAVGLYTINYLIVSQGGCSSFSTSAKVYIGTAGTWSGKINKDWENPGNWICGIIPNSTIDATIPKQVSNFPLVISHSAEVKDLNIADGASLIISGSLKVAGAINNSGYFNLENGTLEMSGSAAQTLSGSSFENKAINNLIVSNTGSGLSVSSIAGDTLKISGQLSFGNSKSILNTGDNITLVSNYNGTASVGKVGNLNAINGKVTVERFINTGTASGQHGKSWQFLAIPTSGQTIMQSWMEGGNKPDNYGTMISGPGGTGAGFDMYSVAPSMKTYNSQTNNWVGVSNTNNLISDPQGYFVFVRGDRNITATNQPANATVLRTKGTLFIGTMPPIEVASNKLQSVGNPYASAIDFSLINKDANVDDKFYVWDPYLYGSYGLGGYQTLSSVNNWIPVPGGTMAYPSGVPNSIIQSGQAFFVHSTVNNSFLPVNSSVSFSENCKVDATFSQNVSRKALRVSANNNNQYLRASLFIGPEQSDLMADGNSVVFSKKFSDEIDGNDAEKISNSGENFGIKNLGKILAIDTKSFLTVEDTIFYNLTNLGKRTYQLRFAPENLESTELQAFLIDKFLNTETPVSLSDSTFINVTVTSNSASSAADRFKIVFRQMQALPVTITSITANTKDANNFIQWTVENESGIQQYEVEKSTDGNHFIQMTIVKANNTKSGNYEATDKNVIGGTNFYRVRIVSVDGKPTYTQIVKVVNEKLQGTISVYPNPIENDLIHLQMENQPAGNYKIRLYNSAGQVLISKNIFHNEGSSSEDIKCDNLPKGVYQLEVNKPNGNEVIKINK